VDQRAASGDALPRPVALAIRSAWTLVGLAGVNAVLMAVFREQLVGSWADHHPGAREAFDQGGRAGLARAGFVAPHFAPVMATMFLVGAMLVWVLAAFLRLGYRWAQLGLSALMVVCAFSCVALGFVLEPPPLFVGVTVVALVVEGVTVILLWHPETRAHVTGPWQADGPAQSPAAPPA